MNRIARAGIILLCTATFSQGTFAKPDLGKIWATKTIWLRLAVAGPARGEPVRVLADKYFVPSAKDKPAEGEKITKWPECMLLKKLDRIVLTAEHKKLSLGWDSRQWTVRKDGIEGLVGIAPTFVFIVGDDEEENQFWIFELYGEKGELSFMSVAHDCGGGMFQQHPQTKFAPLVNAELTWELATRVRASAEPPKK